MIKADTSRHPLLRTPAGVITTFSSLGVVAYAIWVFGSSNDPLVEVLVSKASLILLYLLVCAFGLTILLQPDYGRTLRWAWLMLVLGAFSNVVAEGAQLIFGLSAQANPFPSNLDYLRALYYPLTTIGLLLFPFVFVPRQERSTLWLDLAIVITFFGMILWYFFIAPLAVSTDPGISLSLDMAYPLGDCLILAAVIALIQRDLTRTARWILGFMALATVLSASADSLAAYYQFHEMASSTTALNILWLGGAQFQMLATARLIASGPDMLNDPPSKFSPLRHLFSLALPYMAVIIGLALLAGSIYIQPVPNDQGTGLLVGAYSLVGLALLRQYVVLKENVRLYQTMRRIAWTDSLTEVYNRHFFNEMLPREIERARRYRQQLSVLLMDIDGFKQYNDTYGHLKGDMVLKTVARLFSNQLRSSDTIARFGGDEFVVILPEANRRKATAIARRISEAVAAQAFESAGLSVSIGVASYRPGLTPEQLLDEADQEMYRRKEESRENHREQEGAPPAGRPAGEMKLRH